jgi:hypothetical protein
MRHSKEFKVTQRRLMLRYCGSRRKEHAMNHSSIPICCHLGIFALSAILSTILKTRYHAKIYIVIPSCVPGDATNNTWN